MCPTATILIQNVNCGQRVKASKNSGLFSAWKVFSGKDKGTQVRNRIKIPLALEENEMNEGNEKKDRWRGKSLKDIRKGHRHAVSKCQSGELRRR